MRRPEETCRCRSTRSRVSGGGMKVIREPDVVLEHADPRNFTGDVWRSTIIERSRDNGVRGHRFLYGPGARSHRHIHTGEQVLIVVEGRGLLQWKRSPVT